MGWFIGAVALFCVASVMACCKVGGEADENMGIRTERFVNPTPAPEPMPETWTRYDVPLDDDVQRYIYGQCEKYGVDMSVVLAIIKTESDFDAELVGDNGHSWGLMQIYGTQHTARCVRLGAWNLLDPKQNVRVGIDYLAELLNCGHGMEWALSWYNGHGGEPCDYAYTVLTEAERLLESAQTVVSD